MHTRIHSLGRWARQQSKTIAAVAVGVAIGAVGPALVRAAIPDTVGQVHGCYLNNASVFNAKGTVSIIDSATACPSGTTAINWNQTGIGPNGGFVSDLTNKNFGRASLQNRNFANMDLHGTSFSAANLGGSDFHGVNLTGGTLSGSTAGSNFRNVNFTNANIFGLSEFGDTVFTGSNFTGARFTGQISGGDFTGTTFSNVNFEGVTLQNSIMPNIDFRTAHFVGIDSLMQFNQINFLGANFSSTTIDGGLYQMIFDGDNLTNTNFSNAHITNAQFSGGTTFTGTNFTNAQFKDDDFTGETMSAATVTGATWDNVVCSDGTNSNDHANTCVGHLVP